MSNLSFPTELSDILERLHSFDPSTYAKSRNFVDGNVSYLSPYISRGVLSTKMVMQSLLDRGYDWNNIEKFLQELAWRDYWQQIWKTKGDEINTDLKRPQFGVKNWKMPSALKDAITGIEAIDKGVNTLYQTGYMHNHLRMYTASIACNLGGSRWMTPAKWMYYHLLDGDWASNALSWQWVAGSFSSKKYYANQENINKYCGTSQKNTFLDVDYSQFERMDCPEVLMANENPDLTVGLPVNTAPLSVKKSLPNLIYNYYNLDPFWKKDQEFNRILLLEPEVFAKYPVGKRPLEFALNLARNIEGIQIFVGSFAQLKSKLGEEQVIFKEHPLIRHYVGEQEERDWMFPVKGYYPSFFAFWKKCLKTVKSELSEV